MFLTFQKATKLIVLLMSLNGNCQLLINKAMWRNHYVLFRNHIFPCSHAWQRKISTQIKIFGGTEEERERQGIFTFNYSIAHCVGDGRKRKNER